MVLELMNLLAGPWAATLFGPCYLQVFKLLQGASPLGRRLGLHVLFEPTAHHIAGPPAAVVRNDCSSCL
ncbi:hypothetical protein D9Q98_010368 [Chlorella vulgaris]|uniref:Uncharacterized protein n=1 Tax=Chlorella vulgaris TaxID=3077 RepID=A0A9D4TRU4_CHLVU|nr:hypothetical protein D9Q98_010368 [Chlorella vulgaris]